MTSSGPSDFKQNLDIQLRDKKPPCEGLWRALHRGDVV